MHEFVSFNHQIFSSGETHISAISSATFYGKGIFTTIRISDSNPLLWDKHWFRLLNNSSRIGLNFRFSEDSIKNSLSEIISKNKITNGRARLTFLDESAQGIWKMENRKETSFLITTADFRPLPEKPKLTVSPFRVNSTSPLINIKSCNYLENLLAFEEAKNRGFDEAIRLNEIGQVVSGCLSNIFWIKDDEIFTPSLKTGCLAGTTREYFLEKQTVYQVEESLETLLNADAVFLTSAGVGIKQIFFGEKKHNPLNLARFEF